jgi:hypothetical protein
VPQEKEDLTPSADFLRGTGKQFKEYMTLLGELGLVSHRCNEALRLMDPKHYAHAVELRRRVEAEYPFARALGAVDPLVYEGQEILYNVQSPTHTDGSDPQRGWALIYCAGDHEGGYLYMPHLGLRVRMRPGDMVKVRGRVIKHCVEDWSGGQRISIPHFTHSSVWRMMGMAHLVGAEADGESEDDANT